jgi:hypothetical protein
MASLFDTWTGAVKGGDGAQQEDAPATLFVNRKAAARQARSQRVRHSSPRKEKQHKAVKGRQAKSLARELDAGRSIKPWWW